MVYVAVKIENTEYKGELLRVNKRENAINVRTETGSLQRFDLSETTINVLETNIVAYDIETVLEAMLAHDVSSMYVGIYVYGNKGNWIIEASICGFEYIALHILNDKGGALKHAELISRENGFTYIGYMEELTDSYMVF